MVLFLFSIQSIMGGNESRNLQAGSEEKTLQGCVLMPLYPHLLRSPYTSQDHVPEDSTAHSELSRPTTITNQEMSHTLDYRPIKWRHCLSSSSFFPDPILCKVGQKILISTRLNFFNN